MPARGWSPSPRVTTDWVLLDPRNRIVRIPEDFGLAFMNPEVESEILRVPPPTATRRAPSSFRVRPSELDPIDHVNNAVYVDWLEEALEASGWGSRRPDGETGDGPPCNRRGTLRLEYIASAGRGDSIEVDLFDAPTEAAAGRKQSLSTVYDAHDRRPRSPLRGICLDHRRVDGAPSSALVDTWGRP